MSAPNPYVYFPGTAREALQFYADVFGGSPQLHTLAEFGRTDGPPDAVAHGYLVDSSVSILGSDATGDQAPFSADGLMFSLLGAAAPDTLHRWFDALADGGQVVDALQTREWGATDGRVIDRFGLHWLIGYEPEATEAS